jgi:hypothetical protein
MATDVSTVDDVANLIGAIAWPVVVLVGFFLFRRELPKLVGALAGRVRSVSIAQVSIELTVQEFRPSPNVPLAVNALEELPGRHFEGDSIRYLVEELQRDEVARYVVVDFATLWFSSRLFLYADLLDRARRLPCIVFVDSSGNVPRQFVGMATPRDVCQELVRIEPWLASAYREARVSPTIDPDAAKEIAERFRDELRRAAPEGPISEETGLQWSRVDGQWEHTTKLTVKRLRQILDCRLRTTDYIVDSPDLSEEERRRRVILRGRGDEGWVPFVAALDEERAFVRLLNRARLLEAVARSVAHQTEA